MSRVIVKQLPKNITEDKLRNLFASKGNITDVQLKYTPDGKFRQFAFIGYESDADAQNAIKYFNGTCIQTSRIKVERCAALGAEDKPQSWSKYAKDSKKNLDLLKKEEEEKAKSEIKTEKTKKNKEKPSKVDEILGDHKNDPEFQEFLKVHDKNRSLWDNDAAMATADNKENESNDDDENGDDEKVKEEKQNVMGSKKREEKEEEEDNDEGENEADDAEEDEKLAEKPISDLEYMKSLMSKGSAEKSSTEAKKTPKEKSSLDLFTIKMHNVPYKAKRQDILKFFKPLKPYSVRLPTNVHGFCYVGFKTDKEMVKAMLKNKSFIKGKQVFFSDFTEKNKITKSGKEIGESQHNGASTPINGKPSKWQQQEDSVRNEESVAESGRIFFRNLSYTVTEENLRQVFELFGPVAEVNLPVDTVTRQIKGFGTVTFVMPEHAVQAFNKLDGTDFHGRLFHLIPAKAREEDTEEMDGTEAGLSFKQKKELKLKKSAQETTNWNTLFMGPNAVAEILSKQFGMSKEKILDTSEGGSSAAVRIALGETQIVIEMKKFLEEQGVRLNVFDTANAKRSKTVILAKNLPADTTIADLTPIFAKFGPIGRIILPPSGVTALIEYCDATEARQAFKRLAYSKFKNVPLYLEWAPEDTFSTNLKGENIIPKQEEPVVEKQEEEKPNHEEEKEEAQAEPKNEEAEDEWANEPPEENTTLFLRNLNFKTVQDTIHKHFKHLGPIHTAEVAKRKDPENPRIMNSLGYGFIQFKKSETAERALKQMQFTSIDGNRVELKRSDRTLKAPQTHVRRQTKQTKQTGTKMLVRNIPFQAKEKEVREIFKAFGDLRSLRLPLKMTPGENSHRGFGFVDYINKSEAKKAFEALSQSTHLYGRRLVLEWATNDDEDLTELRKRTAEHFQAPGSAGGKRNKKAVFDVTTNQGNGNDDDDE